MNVVSIGVRNVEKGEVRSMWDKLGCSRGLSSPVLVWLADCIRNM